MNKLSILLMLIFLVSCGGNIDKDIQKNDRVELLENNISNLGLSFPNKTECEEKIESKTEKERKLLFKSARKSCMKFWWFNSRLEKCLVNFAKTNLQCTPTEADKKRFRNWRNK